MTKTQKTMVAEVKLMIKPTSASTLDILNLKAMAAITRLVNRM